VKLGLFGGTFDPPHIGHLIVAQDALEALRLDRILFIPAGLPPHKVGRPITPAATRLAMLQAAVAHDPRFGIETLELERAGPSFTVDTVQALTTKYPGAELFLLMGADQAREFDTWREPERLAAMATLVVLSRSGLAETPDDPGFRGRYVKVTRIDISSTAVRSQAAAGRSVRYLVPPSVEAYIGANGVYSQERNG
jgi:nicotinate-nucleotide adenylyltransferase